MLALTARALRRLARRDFLREAVFLCMVEVAAVLSSFWLTRRNSRNDFVALGQNRFKSFSQGLDLALAGAIQRAPLVILSDSLFGR